MKAWHLFLTDRKNLQDLVDAGTFSDNVLLDEFRTHCYLALKEHKFQPLSVASAISALLTKDANLASLAVLNWRGSKQIRSKQFILLKCLFLVGLWFPILYLC